MGITSESKDYTINDAKRAEKRIREACPWLHLDRHGDYGFKLAVVDYDKGMATIIFQPERHENCQPQIMTTDDQLETMIQAWLQDRSVVDNSK